MNIIQIGSNDGNDHVYQYVSRNIDDISHILLVDASEDAVNMTTKQYNELFQNKKVWDVQHLAIVEDGCQKVRFYTPTFNPGHAHSSLSLNHLEKHGHSSINVYDVNAKNINVLVKEFLYFNCVNSINRLYIDVEGKDIDLINVLDVDTFRIEFIMFEFIHSDGPHSWGGPKLNLCTERLQSKGYTIVKEEFNIIATKYHE